MEKYFKNIYGSPRTKSNLAKKIIEGNNYDNTKVLYIGDSLSDYKNAHDADIQFLGRVPKNIKSYFPKNTQYITEFTEIL